MQIDGSVRAELAEIVSATVVLVDDDRIVGDDDERRVAAGAVGDRRLDVDRDLQAWRDLGLFGVDGADEFGETERGESAVLLASGESGKQDRDVPTEVLGEPGLVVVIAVEVRHVEEVSVLDPLAEVVRQLVVARERKPRSEEGRLEPRVAQDRPRRRLDRASLRDQQK